MVGESSAAPVLAKRGGLSKRCGGSGRETAVSWSILVRFLFEYSLPPTLYFSLSCSCFKNAPSIHCLALFVSLPVIRLREASPRPGLVYFFHFVWECGFFRPDFSSVSALDGVTCRFTVFHTVLLSHIDEISRFMDAVSPEMPLREAVPAASADRRIRFSAIAQPLLPVLKLDSTISSFSVWCSCKKNTIVLNQLMDEWLNARRWWEALPKKPPVFPRAISSNNYQIWS